MAVGRWVRVGVWWVRLGVADGGTWVSRKGQQRWKSRRWPPTDVAHHTPHTRIMHTSRSRANHAHFTRKSRTLHAHITHTSHTLRSAQYGQSVCCYGQCVLRYGLLRDRA
eukprot:822205-Rhodomonas_salina.1